MTSLRIGILGGSFDPVHCGHLLLAESCREACGLDQVWFMPAATPPHKRRLTLAPAHHRIAMLRLATADHEAFQVTDLECVRGGVSYTVDSLTALRAMGPGDRLHLLIGADTLLDLPNWKEPEHICALAGLVVVARRGHQPDWEPLRRRIGAERFGHVDARLVEMPEIGISGTAIRAAVRAGRSIRYQTPGEVEAYIREHGLYGEPELVGSDGPSVLDSRPDGAPESTAKNGQLRGAPATD